MNAPIPDVRRVVYLGTPALAVGPLRALVAAGFEVPLVVSRGDKRRGRGSGVSPSPVKAAALDLGIPVTTDVDAATEVGADLGVVVAFGRLIRPHVLAALPMVNLHFSLLPRWRGAAPVERAILAGDEVTGVCLMALAEELDTGDVYARREVPVGAHTLESLRRELVDVGTDLLVNELRAGLAEPVPQRGVATYAAKITADDLRIDWSASADAVDRTVRVGNAHTSAQGRRLKVWEIEPTDRVGLAPGQVDGVEVGTGTTAIRLVEVQPEGKPRRHAADWANGVRIGPDDRLGDHG